MATVQRPGGGGVGATMPPDRHRLERRAAGAEHPAPPCRPHGPPRALAPPPRVAGVHARWVRPTGLVSPRAAARRHDRRGDAARLLAPPTRVVPAPGSTTPLRAPPARCPPPAAVGPSPRIKAAARRRGVARTAVAPRAWRLTLVATISGACAADARTAVGLGGASGRGTNDGAGVADLAVTGGSAAPRWGPPPRLPRRAWLPRRPSLRPHLRRRPSSAATCATVTAPSAPRAVFPALVAAMGLAGGLARPAATVSQPRAAWDVDEVLCWGGYYDDGRSCRPDLYPAQRQTLWREGEGGICGGGAGGARSGRGGALTFLCVFFALRLAPNFSPVSLAGSGAARGRSGHG